MTFKLISDQNSYPFTFKSYKKLKINLNVILKN